MTELPSREEAEEALAAFAERLKAAREVRGGVLFRGESGTAYTYPEDELAGEFPKMEDAHFYVVARCVASTLLALASIGMKVAYGGEEVVEKVARAMRDARADLIPCPNTAAWMKAQPLPDTALVDARAVLSALKA